MNTHFSKLLALTSLVAAIALVSAQESPKPNPKDTEVWEPVPPVVTPGATDSEPPSDAIVLFDGKNLDQWVSAQDDFMGALRWHTKNVIIGALRNWCRTALEWNLASDPRYALHTRLGAVGALGGVTIGAWTAWPKNGTCGTR